VKLLEGAELLEHLTAGSHLTSSSRRVKAVDVLLRDLLVLGEGGLSRFHSLNLPSTQLPFRIQSF